MDLVIPLICLMFYVIENILEMYIVLILNPQQNWEMLLKGLESKQDGLLSVFGKKRMKKGKQRS